MFDIKTARMMDSTEGKPESQRQLRVGEELRHALANVLQRGELRDPQLGSRPLTVTEVRVSPDLRNAKVFVEALGVETETAVAALTRARSYLRRRIGEMVRLRYVPDLMFRVDSSFERAMRITALLRKGNPARPDSTANRGDGENGAREDR
jgi:ribosome-binding factor A